MTNKYMLTYTDNTGVLDFLFSKSAIFGNSR